MTTPASAQRYTSVAIVLHWLIAAAILGLIGVGWYMGDMPPGAEQYALFQLHKSFGVTVLLLTVARIVWRLMNPPPPEPPMPGWQAATSRMVHAGFYVLMIVMPLSGWILASASPTGIATVLFNTIPWPHLPGLADLSPDAKRQIEEPLKFVHSKLAWVMLALLALHVAAALKHHFVDRDGLMARMAPGLFGRTEPPAQQGRGGILALAAALIVLGAGAGLGVLRPTAAQAAPQENGVIPSSAPYWAVDPARSAIVFRSAYMGRPFEGRFANWTATIQFDTEKPEDARIRVVIPTASARTGEPYFDENLPQGDWFDVSRHPEAVFEVNEGVFKDSEREYEATGVLILKGERYPMRLPFTLDVEGDTGRMHAEVTVERLMLGVGRDTLAAPSGDEEWVADEVVLVIDVVATRQ